MVLIPNRNNTTRVEVTIPTELLEQAKATAEEKGYSFSELVTVLLLQGLGIDSDHGKSDADCYTAQETADILGITIVTLYNWIKANKIDAFKVGGKWAVKKSTVEEILSGADA